MTAASRGKTPRTQTSLPSGATLKVVINFSLKSVTCRGGPPAGGWAPTLLWSPSRAGRAAVERLAPDVAETPLRDGVEQRATVARPAQRRLDGAAQLDVEDLDRLAAVEGGDGDLVGVGVGDREST